jgi:hypothetical protein
VLERVALQPGSHLLGHGNRTALGQQLAIVGQVDVRELVGALAGQGLDLLEPLSLLGGGGLLISGADGSPLRVYGLAGWLVVLSIVEYSG